MKKVCAIIPARGQSKRLPRKNILPILNRPMISYPIQTCLKSNIFDMVIVSTEDNEIAEISKQYGAQVVMRPIDMASDQANELMAYRHVLFNLLERKKYIPDYFCAIYATALFITPQDLQETYSIIIKNKTDVLMGVSEYPIHPFKALRKSRNGFYKLVHPIKGKQRSQKYPKYVASNGTFYWFHTKKFFINFTYYPDKLSVFTIPFERTSDIDTLEDLERAIKQMHILNMKMDE